MTRTTSRTVPVLVATIACGTVPACGPGGDPRSEPASSPSQSIPVSMLSQEGTQALPPAQEFTLDEIGFDFGRGDAPVQVVEFSDYGCGYCRKFHTETFPALMSEYIEEGLVRWKYVTYVSGMFPNGFPAAYVAECAGEQGVFIETSHMLYERQGDWKNLDDPHSVLEEIAVGAGAAAAELRKCVQEERPRPRVRSGVLSGARLGVRGTPSFLVNGRPLVGAQPLAFWKDVIQALTTDDAADDGAADGGAKE